MFSDVWHAQRLLASGHHLKHINQEYTDGIRKVEQLNAKARVKRKTLLALLKCNHGVKPLLRLNRALSKSLIGEWERRRTLSKRGTHGK